MMEEKPTVTPKIKEWVDKRAEIAMERAGFRYDFDRKPNRQPMNRSEDNYEGCYPGSYSTLQQFGRVL